jgi:regulator of RNase E activity RraA
MAAITKKLLAQLAEIDTPTICNTMDVLKIEYASKGFITQPFVCIDPEAPPIVGFAKTATCRSLEPSSMSPAEATNLREAYWDYIAAKPQPGICVMQDLDGERAGFGAMWGEVNSNIHQALGCLGLVTNGSIRDIDMWADDFQAIAGLVGPSHGHVHYVGFGGDVQVLGMWVKDGDLIHADGHGAVVIPKDIAHQIPATAAMQARREKVVLDACFDKKFTMAKLKKAYKDAAKVK